MSNKFNITVQAIDTDARNIAAYVINRPQGVNYWQVNLFHNPMHIRLANQQAITMRGPSVLFFPPQLPQWYTGMQTGFTDDWCSCVGDMEQALQHHGIPIGEPLAVTNISELERCFRAIDREWHDRPLFSDEAIRDLMIEFMRYCARGRLNESLTNRHFADILHIRQQLRLHPQRPWSVSQMATTLNLSENRFSYLYKCYCGTAPQRDLIGFRMQRAMKLIVSESTISIKDVAELCGYPDSMYFSRVFKHFFGRAPSAYRR